MNSLIPSAEIGIRIIKPYFTFCLFRLLKKLLNHLVNALGRSFIPGALMFNIVVMKFIAPSIDDIPAKCRLNIAISTDPPECDCTPDNGG